MSSSVMAPSVTLFPEPKEGIVDQEITTEQAGRVKYDGSYWPARFYDPNCQAKLEPKNAVSVLGIAGITLLVMPINIPETTNAPEQDKITEGDEQKNTLET
ncbi:hypothetical protein NG798_08345 [Ancylothrix sp. C2]|uniref:NfeD family protein n=1 Tax=Ancylothrix sp. D3o TaxID=2953691 RepID=UPI0021BAEF77|nr:NfeD family protein [Ancylothrix sp. D3o]MCT7949795.1 hypothetical protein [Ancylothrix sp. D3o]